MVYGGHVMLVFGMVCSCFCSHFMQRHTGKPVISQFEYIDNNRSTCTIAHTLYQKLKQQQNSIIPRSHRRTAPAKTASACDWCRRCSPGNTKCTEIYPPNAVKLFSLTLSQPIRKGTSNIRDLTQTWGGEASASE